MDTISVKAIFVGLICTVTKKHTSMAIKTDMCQVGLVDVRCSMKNSSTDLNVERTHLLLRFN